MQNSKIGEYLENYNRISKKGTCKTCQTAVKWSWERVASHKRSNCVGASPEEREIFVKDRAGSLNVNTSDVSMNSVHEFEIEANNNSFVISDEKKAEIDSALGDLFFRTGVPFRILDSEVFRKFVQLLNPVYAEDMPKSRTLSGIMLDKAHKKSINVLVSIKSMLRQ